MTALQDFLGFGTTIVAFALVVAAITKVFQIANDVREMKDLLKEMRRGALGITPGIMSGISSAAPAPESGASMPYGAGFPAGSAPTAEELVRAVHAQKFGDDEFPL